MTDTKHTPMTADEALAVIDRVLTAQKEAVVDSLIVRPITAGGVTWDGLEPCPFCGNADLNNFGVVIDEWDEYASVKCICGCRGPTVYQESPARRTSELLSKQHDTLADLAWQAWQKRVSPGDGHGR